MKNKSRENKEKKRKGWNSIFFLFRKIRDFFNTLKEYINVYFKFKEEEYWLSGLIYMLIYIILIILYREMLQELYTNPIMHFKLMYITEQQYTSIYWLINQFYIIAWIHWLQIILRDYEVQGVKKKYKGLILFNISFLVYILLLIILFFIMYNCKLDLEQSKLIFSCFSFLVKTYNIFIVFFILKRLIMSSWFFDLMLRYYVYKPLLFLIILVFSYFILQLSINIFSLFFDWIYQDIGIGRVIEGWKLISELVKEKR